MSTDVTTKAHDAFAFALEQAKPTPVESLPVVVQAPAPPRESVASRISRGLDAFTKSPYGEGVWTWTKGVGAVAGYVVPAACMIGAGIAIAGMPPTWNGAMDWGMGLGAAAGVAQMLAQGQEGLANVRTHKNEGHKLPRLRSFIDVMILLVAPAVGAGYVAAHTLGMGAEAGLWASVGGGVIGSSIGLTILNTRQKRLVLERNGRKLL